MFAYKCPVCGKKPKVSMDLDLYEAGFGACVTIQCKPFLRKAHHKVSVTDANGNIAKEKAISAWNAQIKIKGEKV